MNRPFCDRPSGREGCGGRMRGSYECQDLVRIFPTRRRLDAARDVDAVRAHQSTRVSYVLGGEPAREGQLSTASEVGRAVWSCPEGVTPSK